MLPTLVVLIQEVFSVRPTHPPLFMAGQVFLVCFVLAFLSFSSIYAGGLTPDAGHLSIFSITFGDVTGQHSVEGSYSGPKHSLRVG